METGEIKSNEVSLDPSIFPELLESRITGRHEFFSKPEGSITPQKLEEANQLSSEVEQKNREYFNSLVEDQFRYSSYLHYPYRLDRSEAEERARAIFENGKYTIFELTYTTFGLSDDHFLEAAKLGNLEVKEASKYLKKKSYRGKNLVVEKEHTSFLGLYEANEPDIDSVYESNASDLNVIKLTALKLLQGKLMYKGEKISDFEKLKLADLENGKKLDLEAFIKSISGLLTRESLQGLIDNHVIREEDLPSLYERGSEIAADSALDFTFSKEKVSPMYPFPLRRHEEIAWKPREDTSPDIAFLPFIAYSFLRYMARIPEKLKPGQQMDFAFFSKIVTLLQASNEEVFRTYLKSAIPAANQKTEDLSSLISQAKAKAPEALNDVATINNALNYMAQDFNELLKYYKRHPYLINRRGADFAGNSNILDYQQWRNQLLEHGARAPIKPTKFRYMLDITEQ